MIFSSKRSTGKTVIHRLNPITKIGTAIACTVAALLCDHAVSSLLILLFAIITGIMARLRLPLKFFLFWGITLTIYGFLTRNAGASTEETLTYVFRMAAMTALIPIGAMTTEPLDLINSINKLKLPSGFVMALLLVWRFIPMLKRDLDHIRECEKLRGTGRYGMKERYGRGVLLPLLFSSVEYSEEVSLALETRCFNPDSRRTSFRPVKFGRSDILFIGAAFSVLVTGIFFERGML